MFSYRSLIRQAWEISWHHKYLWFFGLFASLLGNGGEYDFIFRSFSGGGTDFFPGLQRFLATGILRLETAANLPRLFGQNPVSMLIILFFCLLVICLVVFLVWLVMVAQAAIVNNSAAAHGKKKHDLSGGVDAGVKRFWPVFGLNVILKTISWLVLSILSLPFFYIANQSGSYGRGVIYGLAFLIFIPLALAVSFVIKYAVAYAVIKGRGLLTSLEKGWQLFRQNWVVSLEMALILFGINFAVGLGLFFGFLIISVPLVFMAMAFYYLVGAAGFWLIVLLALVIFFIFAAVVGAGLASFQISAWTGLFLSLVGEGGISKIARWIGR